MRKILLGIAALLLAACSSGTGLLEKGGPAPVGGDSLVTPPWQTLVRAGPGAEKDIDYETLDGVPQPPTPPPAGGLPPGVTAPQTAQNAPAAVAPPTSATDQTKAAMPETPAAGQTQAATDQSKANKPGTEISAVAVTAVSGLSAPGSKDLTLAMRKVLAGAGWPVLDKPAKNALTIKGDVKLDAVEGDKQAIHITWIVSAPSGKNIGTVSQNNDVPAHSLDGAWGETADMAAQAAADGIFKLIEKYR